MKLFVISELGHVLTLEPRQNIDDHFDNAIDGNIIHVRIDRQGNDAIEH